MHTLPILQAFAESIGFSGGYAIERSTTASLLSAYTLQVGILARVLVRLDVVVAILSICLLADDLFIHIPNTAFHLERLSVFVPYVAVVRCCCHHAANGLHIVPEPVRGQSDHSW